MKKSLLVFTILLFVVFMVGCENSTSPLQSDNQVTGERSLTKGGKNAGCSTITGGDVYYSATHYFAGQPIPTGYDDYGYNYQGHLFKGSYANVYLGGYGFPPYNGDDDTYILENPNVDDTYIDINGNEQYYQWYWPYRMYEIQMKWNDAWLSNKDCGSQDIYGVYTDLTTPDGKLDRHYPLDTYIGSGAWEMYKEKMGGPDGYTYTSKIIAVPEDANKIGGYYGIWYNADGVEIGPSIWGSFAIIQEVQGGSGVTEHGLLYAGDDHLGLGGW